MKTIVLDLEATGLNALSFITGYGILSEDGATFGHRFLNGKSVDQQERNLLILLRDDVCKYDKMIGHFIRRYDIPLAVSRCLLYGLDAKPFLHVQVVDTWEITRNNLLLPNNTLKDLCHFFGIPKNTALKGSDMPSLYMKAFQGDKATLELIENHCRNDYKATLAVYNKLKPLIETQSIKY